MHAHASVHIMNYVACVNVCHVNLHLSMLIAGDPRLPQEGAREQIPGPTGFGGRQRKKGEGEGEGGVMS